MLSCFFDFALILLSLMCQFTTLYFCSQDRIFICLTQLLFGIALLRAKFLLQDKLALKHLNIVLKSLDFLILRNSWLLCCYQSPEFLERSFCVVLLQSLDFLIFLRKSWLQCFHISLVFLERGFCVLLLKSIDLIFLRNSGLQCYYLSSEFLDRCFCVLLLKSRQSLVLIELSTILFAQWPTPKMKEIRQKTK